MTIIESSAKNSFDNPMFALIRRDHGQMRKTPPAARAPARICSIVGGVSYVWAKLRLFSRQLWSLASTCVMVAVFGGDMFGRLDGVVIEWWRKV